MYVKMCSVSEDEMTMHCPVNTIQAAPGRFRHGLHWPHLEVVDYDAALTCTAAKEGNALCMLAQAQVHVAEGCLQPVLLGCQRSEVWSHSPARLHFNSS